MKVGILTYYGVHNHGAVLQANGLKEVLKYMGCEVEFLQFNRNYDFIPAENAKKYSIGPSSVKYYSKYLIEKGPKNILYNLKKANILNSYRAKNIKLGARYSDFDGDAVVIGSDEVFSFEIGINPFFYGQGLKAKKVLSYAGCFGPTTIDFLKEHSLESMVSSGFNSMQAVGVRDKNSYNIACALTNNDKVQMVCDPVILYGYKKEMNSFIPEEKDYMIIYSYDKNMNSPEEVTRIKEFAKNNNLQLISICYYHGWCDKVLNLNPIETLCYIKNAKYVLTDTFHGTVISLITGAQFLTKLRGNQNKIGSLLDEYDLADRIIDDFNELDKYENIIDYDVVHEKMTQIRAKSYRFLRNALNGK